LVDAVIAVQRGTIEQVRRLAAGGQQFQIDLVAAGHLDELQARLAWSQASRDLFE
jgi:hypothetical protein